MFAIDRIFVSVRKTNLHLKEGSSRLGEKLNVIKSQV